MRNRIEDVRPRDDKDDLLFAELREVLERHAALDRFGVVLLHSHFDVSDHEIFVESVNPEERTLTIRPVPIDKTREAMAIATSWRFSSDSVVPISQLQCFPAHDKDGNIVGHML